MCSMRIQHQGDLNGAIKKGDLDRALMEARRMAEYEPLTVMEALDLLLLIARLDNPRFEKAAEHWQELHRRGNPSAVEQRIADAAIEGLGRQKTRERCAGILRALVCEIAPES